MEKRIRMLIDRWKRRARRLDDGNFWDKQKFVNVEIDTLKYCIKELEMLVDRSVRAGEKV